MYRRPAGVCDNCSRFSWTLIEIDIKCFFCPIGYFRSSRYWTITWCHKCRDKDFCEHCNNTGIEAHPQDQPGDTFPERLL
jgi:hypothetical protein